MDDVAAREVPVYFEVEEEIISAPSKVVGIHRSACSPNAATKPLAPSLLRVQKKLKCVFVCLFLRLWRCHNR